MGGWLVVAGLLYDGGLLYVVGLLYIEDLLVGVVGLGSKVLEGVC